MNKTDNLEAFNLIRNPFFELTPENEYFQRLFVGREDVMGELNAIISFYKNGTRQNIILIGESGVGKTTILNNLMIYLDENELEHIYVPYSTGLEDFIKQIAKKMNRSIESKNLRDMRIEFLSIFKEPKNRLVIIIDNFEDLKSLFDKNGIEDFIEIIKRSPFLFICASVKDSWNSLLSSLPELSEKFHPISIKPFDVEASKNLFAKRLELYRIKKEGSIYRPFTEGSIELISIYSFFVARKMMEFGSKMLLRAVLDKKDEIDEKMVKDYIFNRSGFAEYINKVSKRQITLIEEMIKNNGEGTISFLAECVGISSVAVAENIQKLIKLGLIEEFPTPGKKKNFRITDKLKVLLS